MSRQDLIRQAVAAVLGLTLAWSVASASGEDPFVDCLAKIQADPDSYGPYQCVFVAAQNQNAYEAALTLIERQAQAAPDHPWIELQRAKLIWLVHDDATPFQSYAAEARGTDRATQVIRGYIGVSSSLRNRGQLDRANQALLEAEAYADALSPLWVARVRLFRGRIVEKQGAFSAARELYDSARPAVEADGDLGDRALLWGAMGNLAYRLGERDDAIEAYGLAAEAYDQAGDAQNALGMQLNQIFAMAFQVQHGTLPPEPLIERALDVAEQAERLNLPAISAGAYEVLCDFAPTPEDSLEYAREAMRLADLTAHVNRRVGTMNVYAERLIKHGSDAERTRGFALQHEAIDLAERHAMIGQALQIRRVMAEMARRYGSREMAIEVSLDAVEQFEKARNLQLDEDIRRRFFGYTSTLYAALEGYLVAGRGTEHHPPDFEMAFEISERSRARTLHDWLEVSGTFEQQVADEPLIDKREAVLREIRDRQRQLARPLDATTRQALLDDLESLEARERQFRVRLAERYEWFRPMAALELPRLADVQATLQADEALINFSADHAHIMRTLVTVHTRETSWAVALELEDLEASVHLLHGLIERRDGSERELSRRLFDALLAEAMQPLPDAVRRLIVIPSGPLHLLPFDLLESSRTGRPLVADYELHTALSVALWHRWRQADTPAPTRSLLALAAPRLPDAESAMQDAGGVPGDGLRALAALGRRFGELPFAELEAKRAIAQVGGVGRTGSQATEAYLKQTDVARFGILHLATHGIIDDEHPDRSAVLLAPGGAAEDGLLQPRDLIELNLHGRMVVLSACRSATGPIIDGDGVIGLARGFFQAGAHAVVGSLWPIQDRQTADLIESFYRHLRDGQTVSRALTLAKRERIAAGAPAADWAGVVLSGLGDLRPVVEPGSGAGLDWLAWAVALGAIVAAAVWGLLRLARTGTAQST